MGEAISKVKQYRLIDWCWLICGVSHLGFLVENIWNIATSGQIDNRNMNLPFILGYGLAILGIYLFFGTPKDDKGLLKFINTDNVILEYVLYSAVVTLFICINEIMIGEVVEHLSQIHYWDFSDVPLHITPYTSLLTASGYSIIITLFMSLCFDKIMCWLTHFDDKGYKITGVILIIFLILNFIVSFETMITENDYNWLWSIQIT